MRGLFLLVTASAALLFTAAGFSQSTENTAPATDAPIASSQAAGMSTTPPSRGKLIAIAGDCAACHANPAGGSEFSGGFALATPMGKVYARNITSDPKTGIGGWTLQEFDQALRGGRSKNIGHLYPAMPYTSYRYMTDDDVKALYDYLMDEVQPVQNAVPETHLGFPFLRSAMVFWDALFSGSGKAPTLENASPQIQRGQYLVDVLGHCGECHTPRGLMLQSKAGSEHLGGAVVGSWYAPNISSDKNGIGRWTDEELKKFLEHGKVKSANAGGDMGLAVRVSLSQLPQSDLDAVVAYLKATPPVVGQPLAPVVEKVAPIEPASVEPVNADYKAFFDASSTNGTLLYLSACAACHGVDGSLAKGAGPSLTHSGAVRASNPINVVQTITTGINLGELDQQHLMPSFRSELNDAQIAAIASYVRQRFGGIQQSVSESEVVSILKGTHDIPWLLLNARWLAWLGLIAGFAVVIGGGLLIARRARLKKAV
ncbi:MAG: c-type cytochrome [Phycisphaerales bacterium]|nr:c-type cytochrome [Phycisphaerales bacterium]